MSRNPSANGWRGRRLSHPLSGANLGTLLPLLSSSGGVAGSALPQALLALGATVGRWPFSTAERVYVAGRLRRAPALAPPVFILGHWRSGTTHLYNVMSRDEFGYVPPLAVGMPWDLFGIVGVLRPLLERLLPADRFIDSLPVNPDSPQEDEIAIANMCVYSFYHAIYFPRRFDRYFDRGVFLDGCGEAEISAWQGRFRYFLEKLSLQQGGRRMLIKNPVYTARVSMLRRMFPDAKFIHIHRSPYDVFPSMRRFYAKLFEQFALQDYDHVPIDDVILKTYSRMMDRLTDEAGSLPDGTFAELRYETLIEDPLGQIRDIYDTLGIPGFDAAQPEFEAYLNTVRAYRANRYSYSEQDRALVERHWQRFIDRWGYERPAIALPTEPSASRRAAGAP